MFLVSVVLIINIVTIAKINIVVKTVLNAFFYRYPRMTTNHLLKLSLKGTNDTETKNVIKPHYILQQITYQRLKCIVTSTLLSK